MSPECMEETENEREWLLLLCLSQATVVFEAGVSMGYNVSP